MSDKTTPLSTSDNGKQKHILADPHAELPVKNFKYVKNCVELYLAERGIDEIARFDAFVNLEVLWLNNNRIEKLEGLGQCFRIKELYAHSNRIRTLDGSSLIHFKFLRVLRLNDNKLRDFPSTLTVLAKLHHLEDLDLFNNSVEEEDNYRLHVIRAVPSLLVLDRHVVTNEERAKAARLRDEPAVVRPSKEHGQKKAKHHVVAGAPPQSLSGTVRLLFKEVEIIEREREAARKEALAQELARMNQQQRQLTHQSAATTSSPASTLKGGLDPWELAALEKRFRSLEAKPKGGIAVDRLPTLMAYLRDRGYEVICNSKILMTDGDIEGRQVSELSTIFSNANVLWQQFQQSFEKCQLQCRLMTAKELKRQGDVYFAEAAAIQKRLSGAIGDDARAKLLRESHDVAQRAYHLTALAENKVHDIGRDHEQTVPRRGTLSPLRTRYYATTFARDEAETNTFHELNDQTTRVDAALTTKYKFQQKDFQKYMTKQAPPATRLVRRHFNM